MKVGALGLAATSPPLRGRDSKRRSNPYCGASERHRELSLQAEWALDLRVLGHFIRKPAGFAHMVLPRGDTIGFEFALNP